MSPTNDLEAVQRELDAVLGESGELLVTLRACLVMTRAVRNGCCTARRRTRRTARELAECLAALRGQVARVRESVGGVST